MKKTWNFEYQNLTIKVEGLCFEQDENLIYSSYFSDDIDPNNQQLTSIVDILEDMNILFANLNGSDFNMQSIANAYSSLIINHINMYGRLIDRDIEGYLDRVMHFIVSLTNSLNYQLITDEQGIEIKNNFRRDTYDAYKDYIWLNKPIIGKMNPFQTHELVKYSK